MKRWAGPIRTAPPKRCVSRSIRHIISARHITAWEKMPAPAIRSKREYGRLQSRNEEIDGIIGSLYADKSKGILSEKRFVKMLSDLETEQSDNEARMQELSKHLNESDAQDGDIRLFIDEIRKAGVIRELDEAVLNRLINRILSGKR